MTVYAMTPRRAAAVDKIRAVLALGRSTRFHASAVTGMAVETVGRYLNGMVASGEARRYFDGRDCTWGLTANHIDPASKRCTTCGVTKDLAEFARQISAISGLASACKECHGAKGRAHRIKNHDRLKKQARAKYAARVDEIRAKDRLRYALNPEMFMARSAAYRKKHPDRAKQCVDAWKLRNPDRVRANKAVASGKRRAAIAAAGGSFTASDLRKLMTKQRCKCTVCRKSLKKGYHIDHVRPIALGGTNDKLNIQLLCPLCNLQKHAKDPIDFMRSRGFLL